MRIEHNFLPGQYQACDGIRINHNYLIEQFSDYDAIFKEIEKVVLKGDYTLGESVDAFERNIAERTGARFVIGTGSGTDALFLSMKAAGVGRGDEVITTPYTFHATVGAIVTAGATPVFVDIGTDYNIDAELIEKAVTKRTKAIVPVHWAGLPCRMDRIVEIARQMNLVVIEDACHALGASYHGRSAGTFGLTGCFSLHPLKNLNVWGDGGFIVTDSEEMHDRLVLMRNHGLVNRDTCLVFAYNSRLDAIQAAVANHMLGKIDHINTSRIANAALFDRMLADIPQITTPGRPEHVKQVFHLYILRARRRDALKQYLMENGIDAKIHYPTPMHLQPAAEKFGYHRGDFPVCEAVCDSVISLPVHEFITTDQVAFMAEKVRAFYAQG